MPSPPTRLSPLSPGRYTIQVTIARTTHDKLRYARALLGHSVPSGDVALVLDRALDALIAGLEQRKLGATRRAPRQHPRPTRSPHHVPAHVRRAVWERDGGQCTFVGEGGRRCDERLRLEFDHIDPVARGGWATTDRMRPRCRGHNQFEADQAFGAVFMRAKRQVAQRARSARTNPAAAVARSAVEDERTREVIAGLRTLGMRADEARRAAEASRGEAGATIEERLRRALQSHRPRVLGRTHGRIGPPGGTASPTSGAASMESFPAPGP